MQTRYSYLTFEELQKMYKSEEVYVRTIILYAHVARIQDNPAQKESLKVLRKAISNSKKKDHLDPPFAKMCAGEVLLVFEKYFEDYKNFVTK